MGSLEQLVDYADVTPGSILAREARRQALAEQRERLLAEAMARIEGGRSKKS